MRFYRALSDLVPTASLSQPAAPLQLPPRLRTETQRVLVLTAACEKAGARLCDILTQRGACDVTVRARIDTLDDILNAAPDLVIVDSSLERRLFSAVIAALKEDGCPPIIAFGCTADVERAAWVLESGADAWVDTDASPELLLAQVNALMRCRRAPIPLRVCDLSLNPSARSAVRAGRRISLSPKEYEVLYLLMSAAGRTVSLAELATQVWDHHAVPSLDTYRHVIRSLRRKLEQPGKAELLHTVWREGYRLGPP